MRLRDEVLVRLWDRLGLCMHPTKGIQEPTQCLTHLGLAVDTSYSGRFYAPADKLVRLVSLARDMLCAATRRHRAVPAKRLAALAGMLRFRYLAIPAARFYLRELHSVLATRSIWSGTVKLLRNLTRDMQWWTAVSSVRNGRSIFRELEITSLRTDSSGFAWGAVLKETSEARGILSLDELARHITRKDLRAVRLGELSLRALAGRRVLLHEDNHAVVSALAGLTSRSPALMAELRLLRRVVDTPRFISAHTISGRPTIAGPTVCRAHGTAPITLPLPTSHLRRLDRYWAPRTVDRFASAANAVLPRFNAR